MDNNGNPQNMNQLYQTVGEIKGTVKAMDKKLDASIKNHEDRINDVEHSVDNIKGKVGIIGAIAGFVSASIIGVLFKKLW